ncbi:MAG: hypothetical protein M1416_02095 [Candidatus Pacearchaeota archaeon]|nr:hypothetical protein [Candidatus Pacearchaeota archaeon]
MRHAIEDLIEIERQKIPFDNADFLDSTEKKEIDYEDFLDSLEQIEPEKNYIDYWEVVKSGIICGPGGVVIGGIFGALGTIVGALTSTGIGCYLEYKIQKTRG